MASGVSFRATHLRLIVNNRSVFSLWGIFFDSFFHHFFRNTFLPLKFTTCDQKAQKMTSKAPHFGDFWWVGGIHGNPCFTIVKHRFLRFWEVPFHDFCVTFFMVSTFSHSLYCFLRFLAENVLKWVPGGGPKILKFHQKSCH